MRFVINEAGNRIVIATAEETHALRPAIRAAFRRWRANEADIEDLCQEVEIITWRAIEERRLHEPLANRPQDALWQWSYAAAWNLWRNHCRRRWIRCEVLTADVPEVEASALLSQLEARDTLRMIATKPHVAGLLLASLEGDRGTMPRSTFWHHVAQARRWVREMEAEPKQPLPATPKHRKKKR